MGECLICAIFGKLGSVMVVGAVFCNVWTHGCGVSLSGVVGCKSAEGGGLIVGGANGLPAEQKVQVASCF